MKYLFFIVLLVIMLMTTGCANENKTTVVTTNQATQVPTVATSTAQPTLLTNTPFLQSYGDVTGQGYPSDGIFTITFSVGISDIHEPIDSETLSILFADPVMTQRLLPVTGFRGDPPIGFWGIIRVENEVGNPNNLLEKGERFVIKIYPKRPLGPQTIGTIEIKSSMGESFTIKRQAPRITHTENVLSPIQ